MNIFFSYAKLDNQRPYKLSRFREAFSSSLDATFGYRNRIFFDEIDLKWGVKWKKEIENFIKKSDAFISILSPSYFNSRMCIYEFSVAIKENIFILPIYYRNCPKGLESRFKTEDNDENITLNAISKRISDFQYKDFRNLKHKNLDSEEVQIFLDSLSEDLIEYEKEE